MGYMVADRLEVSIFIADEEYPLDLGSGNILNFFHMGASTKLRLPQCCFSLVDTTHTLDRINLQDAIPIRVSLRGQTGSTVTYNFRRFDANRVLTGNAWEYKIDGYLDSVRFWTGTTSTGIEGSSDTALSQIAQACGLKYSGIQTNDNMLWMPGNRKFHAFASMIEQAGYIDNQSLMRWAVDFDGTLRYRNVNNLPDKDNPKKLVAYEEVPEAFTVMDYKPDMNSGFNNASSGYMSTRVIQSAIAENFTASENTLSFTSDSRSPEFNKVAREKSQRGRISHSPIDFGNVHAQYERAQYQNKRYASLLGVGIEFLMTGPTNIKLFDTVNFATQTEQQQEDRMFSGTYVVTGRAIFVKGATYGEKIWGARNGTNLDYIAE